MKKLSKVLLVLTALLLFTTACTPDTAVTQQPTQAATQPATQQPTQQPTATPEPEPDNDTRLVVMSDIHLCDQSWYGITSEQRVDKMIDDLNAFKSLYDYSAMLFLGDYSLDYWESGTKGSYRNRNISNTDNFFKNYASRLQCKDRYIIPGNHEQYGAELWKSITGFDRQYYVKVGGYLIFMLDNFDGDLDPDDDNHGVYTATSVDYINGIMEHNPDMPVLLCAHYFDLAKETAEFSALLNNERVIALFCGHDHVTTVQDTGAENANKIIFHCGQYSYTKATPRTCPWGWRTLTLNPKGITVTYYTPASTMVDGGNTVTAEAGYTESYFIPNPLCTQECDVTGFNIAKLPDKLRYKEGEKVDLTGIKCVFTDENGTAEITDYTCETASVSKAGKANITVKYGIYRAMFTVDVVKAVKTNLCAGATVTGTAANKEKNKVENLIDGDTDNTKYCVTGTEANLPPELEGRAVIIATVDLQSVQTVGGYALFGASQSASESGITKYDMRAWFLQVSADGVTWNDVSAVSGNTQSVYKESFTPQSARYVRLCFPENGGSQTDSIVRIYELEVYAD